MGIIYLLTNGNEHYKIGITTRKTTKRIKELQTGNSEEINIVNEFKSEWFRQIESAMHRKYGTKRLKGEWFELQKKDTQNFISECRKLHDTFELLKNSGNPFI